ncbi:MAG: exo-alpha-sialidase, partial [Rubrivivax sp.]|nr:exo-alpha-sialidase [Rubrivivax sp.]
VWAGTIPGGLFRSADFGASWQLVDALWQRPERADWFGGGYDAPGIHSICPHPQRPDELLVGISCGGAWVKRDGGAAWQVQSAGMRADFMPPERAGDPNIQDPHRIVRCNARPEVLWCQHHCGIWRSSDDAASWHEVKAPLSSFGFAVAVHPHDADTAWFVPAVKDERRVPVGAALAVNRTRDGGASFETHRAGLPQQDCYDLVYRHGLAVADDGRTLLMGSTTGGLWASMDGGEHWQTVSLHLPPIYAVRFG